VGLANRRDFPFKADQSLKSFVFTLKNPRNSPARKFALKAERKGRALICDYSCGPGIGHPCSCDIRVSDKCNANTLSYSSLGYCYANDTAMDGKTLTGSHNFTVKEIEVFEITD
jgi:hypothetical protein